MIQVAKIIGTGVVKTGLIKQKKEIEGFCALILGVARTLQEKAVLFNANT